MEKYLFELETNANALMVRLRGKGYGLRIIRPRGFVLIGKRKGLDSAAERAFKILNDSLKNLQVVFFDDLFDSMSAKLVILKKRRK